MLETERLIMRPWHVGDAADAKALYKYASSPNVGPRAAWMPHTSVEQSAEIIRDVLSAPGTFAVVLKATCEPVGAIGLDPVSDYVATPGELAGRKARELGYWIGEPYWGRGLIPEAGREVLRYGFEDMGLDEIWATHNVVNRQSARVQDKLGLRKVRVEPHVRMPLLGDDVYRDHVVRRLTREQWLASVQ